MLRSRPVTEDDVACGCVAFGPEAGDVLPASPARVDVELRGRRLFGVRWTPAGDSEHARSVLCPGAEALADLVRPGTELELTVRGELVVLD